ncbi:hypothetical protein FSP39_019389 [Pinctada imbricata]|uniref:Uncharacterized protein n=1 Tax=Pinctada imbricata TaxID=66713 RepID=A0AA88YIV4_PINIB|nr:hypothetical protein FSP39_019389 [Pinctada imbricata]
MAGLKQTEKVPGNANNIIQPRFHKTDKKKGRPRKTPLRKPTEQEKEQLLAYEDPSENVDDTPQAVGPSVAPYPPLRLVQRSTPLNAIPSTPEQPLFQVNGELGVPSWMRIPPSMIGSRVTVTTNTGKKQVLLFSRGEASDKNDEQCDNL